MAEHSAFGAPGGSRRVADEGGCSCDGLVKCRGGGFIQRKVRGEDGDVGCCPDPFASLGFVHDGGRGACIAYYMRDFGLAVCGVRRNDHQAQTQTRHVGHDSMRAALGGEENAVARSQSGGVESPGGSPGSGLQFAVTQGGTVSEAQGGPFGGGFPMGSPGAG